MILMLYLPKYKMLQTLSNKLKALFDTLKGTWKPFVSVFDYHTLENTWYPYLSFEPIWFEAEIADTCNNMRTYVFQVLIFQEITETGWRLEAKEIIMKSVDDVVHILDANYDLDWLVSMVQPVWATIKPFIINNWKALVCEMTINIKVIEFIN